MYKRSLMLAVGVVLANLVAVPAMGAVMPARDLLPDGDTRPIVVSATLETPQPHNSLLEADIVIDAYDNDGIARYEYRWSGPTIQDVHPVAVLSPTVTYESVRPGSSYALDVRAVDVNNNSSDWYHAWQGKTPAVPNVIVAGDSIASGYTREWFTGEATCIDSGYSYGHALAAEVAASLPTSWAPTYTNVAWAGAGVDDMVEGGADSCGVSHTSQVDRISALASPDTWNVVAITAGINSTNWTDVIVELTADATLSLSASGDKDACDSAVTNMWNIESKRTAVSQETDAVSSAITSATNAQVLWTGYYDITDTELAPLYRPITGACSDEMSYALDTLHGALRAGLSEQVKWVDIDTDIATQKWAGWPHPSPQGQATIAHRIALSLNS
ncbi:MAG: SGNH/GDSL hydrolase family protein [Actinomycetota bacterium]